MRSSLITGLILVLATAAPLRAQAPTTAEQWIAKANAVSDIRAKGSPPFHLHAIFHASGNVEVTGDGTYDLVWLSPIRWREEISLGAYHYVATQDGDLGYRDPIASYLPLRAVQVMGGLLESPALPGTGATENADIPPPAWQWALTDTDVPTGSIGLRRDYPSSPSPTGLSKLFNKKQQPIGARNAALVIDPSTGHVTRDGNWSYSNFVPFHDKQVARDGVMQATTDSPDSVASFQITILEDAGPRPDADFVLSNAPGFQVFRPHVDTIPKVTHSVDPKFSKFGRKNRIEGSCLLSMLVDPQGRIHDLHVVKSLEPSMDANAMDAVRQYKFDPATRDGQPINFPLTIEIDFHIL